MIEVCADLFRRVYAVHPVAAVYSQYSLWTGDVEQFASMMAEGVRHNQESDAEAS